MLRLEVCYVVRALLLLLLIPSLQCLDTLGRINKEILKTIELTNRPGRVSESNQNHKEDFSNRRKRSISFNEIQCTPESLLAILQSCEISAAASLNSSSSRRKRRDPDSFCGASCSALVFQYVNRCGLQEFILNVSGACKLDAEEFTVYYVHAAVVMKPGINKCFRNVKKLESQDIAHLVDSSRPYVESQCCSMQTYHNSSIPEYAINYDPDQRDYFIEPPLVPPWKIMTDYPPLSDITTSALCMHSKTTTTTEVSPTTVPLAASGSNVVSAGHSGTCRTNSRSGYVLLLCFALILFINFYH